MVAPFQPFEPHGRGGPRIREIPLRVIKVDPKNKRIVLSVTAYLKTRDEDEVRQMIVTQSRRLAGAP